MGLYFEVGLLHIEWLQGVSDRNDNKGIVYVGINIGEVLSLPLGFKEKHVLIPGRNAIWILAVLLAISGCAGQSEVRGFGKGQSKDGSPVKKLAPSVSTPMEVVERMPSLAAI